MGRRTFPDRGAQLALPLGGGATHVASVSEATLVVEPSAHHVEHALARGAPAVTTLALLEARLVRALLPRVRVADAAVARVVLRQCTESLVAPDLLDALDGALTALHAADVDGDHLARATAAAPPGVRSRAELLASAMRAHERALAALGLVDRRAIPSLLSRALARAPLESLEEPLCSAHVVELRNFAALPPARLAWLEALHTRLARVGRRVVIHSPTAPGSLLLACGIDDPRERIASVLEARFQALRTPPELVHEPPGGVGPFAAVAARLFTHATTAEGAVPLLAAASARAQAEHAAAIAARALAAGLSPERIVIALPTADESVMRPLRRALTERRVPFYEGRGAPPTDTLAVATLLRLLRAIDDRPRKDLLIDLLRGVPSASSRSVRIRTADALARLAGSDLRRDGAALVAALDEELRPLVEQWISLLSVPPRPSFAAALAHLRALGDALGFPAALGRHAADVVQSGDSELLSSLAHDLSAWASLAAATDELSRAVDLAGAHDLTLEWRDLARELELALSARHLVPGHRAGAIAIERLRDRLGLDAEVLVVLEAHDGALPSRGGPDPLLSRALVAALRAADPRRAPPPSSLSGAVDLLAATDALGRATREAAVIYRAVDDAGRTQLPGALALELARVSGAGARPLREQPAAATLPLAAIAPRVEAELERMRAFAAATADEPSEASPFAGFIGAMSPTEAELLAGRLGATAGSALSVSAAEKLLACPFLVFAERVLRADPKDRVDDDGSARELGDLAHRALLAAHRSLAEGNHDYAAVVRRVLDEEATTSALQRVRRERLYGDLLATLGGDLEKQSLEGASFLDGERAFGDGEPWPALDLGGVYVRGQIDRIDRAPHGATVVDYKSRRPVGSTTAAFFERRAPGSGQIALYARVVKQNLVPEPERVLARFIGYRDREVGDRFVGFSKKDEGSAWAAHVGDAGGGQGAGEIAEALGREVAAMRGGAVPARRNVRCDRCAQRTACRVPPVVIEESRE